jgi:isopenicillin N synthase-like dioxygenase
MASSLPIIDISGLTSASRADRQAVAAAMGNACRRIGFFYITNHGIPNSLIQDTFAQAKRFFDQSLETKLQVDIKKSDISRGYEAIGTQTFNEGDAPDLKESFYIGVERDDDDPLVQAKTPNHGPNQWPTALPEWRGQMEAYFTAMLTLSQQLMAGLALSLELAENFFAPMGNNPMALLRLLHYPPRPERPLKNQPGCGTHTDWGAITILAQDDRGGLEVRNTDGQWIEATPVPGTFVINLGDMMARWTNGLYQSTPHRVMNVPGADRYSLPFFNDLNYHARVECLPTCQSPDNPPQYPPIKAGEHILEMYRKTYGYLGMEIQ